jgi:DNA-binding CsgD family transcriptional regulator/tetratricopeptide (TPR) repeat protein
MTGSIRQDTPADIPRSRYLLAPSARAANDGAVLPLRGRATESDLVASFVDDVREGHGRVVVVSGPPGIGKTRLIEELIACATTRGVRVAVGRAHEFQSVAPFAPLFGALTSGSFPVLKRDEVRALERPGDQRYWLVEDLVDLLELRSAATPVVVALDDLHWADDATIWAVAALTQRLEPSAIGWLLTTRSHATHAPLHGLLNRLDSSGATRIELTPLSDDEAEELATDVLGAAPDADVRSVIAATRGNPLLAIELLRGYVADGLVHIADGTATLTDPRLPTQLRDRVQRQVRALPSQALDVLRAGAVLGQSFTSIDVARVVGVSASQLVAALREALSIDVLAEDGDHLAFRHELLRETVYDDIPVALRAALHRAAAAAILARGGDVMEAAGHLVAVAQPGDSEATNTLMAAAARAAAHAPRIAAELAEAAVRLMPDDAAGWSDAVVGTVQLLAWASRFSEAEALATRALRRRLSAEAEARLRIGHLDSLLLSARRVELVERGRDALAWPALPDAFRCAFLHNLGQGLAQLGEIDAARQAYLDAIASTTGADADAELAYSCRIGLSLIEGSRGHMLESLDAIQALVKDAETGSASEQRRMPWLWYSCALAALDRLAEADDALQTARYFAKDLGASWAEEFTQRILTALRLSEGRIDDAIAEAEASLDLIETLDMWFDSDTAFGVLAIASIHRNELDAARGYLARSERHRPTYAHNPIQTLAIADAFLGSTTGDAARVERTLAEVVDRPEALIQSLAIEPTQAPQVVRLALSIGDRDRAVTVATTIADIADRNAAAPLYRACALHAHGLVHRDPATLADAADQLRKSPRHLAVGAVFEDAADALLEHDKSDDAVTLFLASLAAWERAGASRDETRVRARLRELGVRRRARGKGTNIRPVSGWDSLTVAENRVARLAADGRTNKQIAEQLYLSPYTVATHLKHIFTKLDVTSRVELARDAAQA